MNIYQDVGVKPVTKTARTFTGLVGLLRQPEGLAVMNDAAGSFVHMHELHLARIEARNGTPHGLWLSPDLLADGEEETVSRVIPGSIRQA